MLSALYVPLGFLVGVIAACVSTRWLPPRWTRPPTAARTKRVDDGPHPGLSFNPCDTVTDTVIIDRIQKRIKLSVGILEIILSALPNGSSPDPRMLEKGVLKGLIEDIRDDLHSVLEYIGADKWPEDWRERWIDMSLATAASSGDSSATE